jgi:hypothetical protein
MRAKLDRTTIDRYAKAYRSGAEFPPISIAVVDGRPIVVDGWHRLKAQRKIGRPTVEAFVATATKSEALAMAAQANLRNGLPLKRKELLSAFKTLIRANQHMQGTRLLSYRELQDLLGGIVRHTTIRNWMIRHFPRIARQYSGEAVEGSRGEPRDSDLAALSMARHAAVQALTLVGGIKSPVRRGEVIAFVESALARLKAGAKWTAPQLNDDF